MIPMYEPLETSKCEKCGKIIEPKEPMQGAYYHFSSIWVSLSILEFYSYILDMHSHTS